ncbi:hypothetical protein WA026_021400 [Henosepilachna vigintioctopunctata]|uniref:Uncharacterized protein n=1 Tax=Henosepilachna vigintioctopunctata TaxID=420089 RepID=A0AAW1TXM7_9CUCU
MTQNSSGLSKITEKFNTLQKARRETLENILKKVQEAREKINKEYSCRNKNVRTVKDQKNVAMNKTNKEIENIVADFEKLELEDSKGRRYKLQKPISCNKSNMLRTFRKP